MKEVVIESSFELSVCLHLNKDAKFAFKILGKDVVISTSDVISEYSRFGRGQNVEIYSDTDSQFRYSQVKIQFKDPDSNIPEDRLSAVYETLILAATNRFIDAYRFVTGRVAISNIASINDLARINCGRRTSDGGAKFTVSLNFGGVGIAGSQVAMGPFKPDLPPEQEEEIRTFLNYEEITLENYFIMDAKRHIQIGHQIQALICAVIALEIALVSSKSKNNWLIRFLYSRGLLGYNLIKELRTRIHKDDVALIVGGINLRNKIIHGGQRSLTIDVKKFIAKAEIATSLLNGK